MILLQSTTQVSTCFEALIDPKCNLAQILCYSSEVGFEHTFHLECGSPIHLYMGYIGTYDRGIGFLRLLIF